MKRANTIRKKAKSKYNPQITLSKLIKLKRLEKQIKESSDNDLVKFEKTILEFRTFSKRQK